MLDAQGVVYLPLKLSVRADLTRHHRRSVRFHRSKRRRWSERRHFAYAGFSGATSGVIRAPSFEIAPKLWRPLEEVTSGERFFEAPFESGVRHRRLTIGHKYGSRV
jgi:hypothetical protein